MEKESRPEEALMQEPLNQASQNRLSPTKLLFRFLGRSRVAQVHSKWSPKRSDRLFERVGLGGILTSCGDDSFLAKGSRRHSSTALP